MTPPFQEWQHPMFSELSQLRNIPCMVIGPSQCRYCVVTTKSQLVIWTMTFIVCVLVRIPYLLKLFYLSKISGNFFPPSQISRLLYFKKVRILCLVKFHSQPGHSSSSIKICSDQHCKRKHEERSTVTMAMEVVKCDQLYSKVP